MPIVATDLLNDPLLRAAPTIEGFKVLPPVVLYSKLGQGGMGAVYRGRHVKLDLDVAVKCLSPSLTAQSEDFVRRFQREARLAASITHQNVVKVMDVHEKSGIHYLVMELVRGETARERVQRKGALREPEAVAILFGAALGLQQAHSRGIVHRDIKPDNLMISVDGVVKLSDLGLAKGSRGGDDLGVSMSVASGVMGTPQYMAPEQWDSPDVGPAADVWALGATLYYLLAGSSAIPGNSIGQIVRAIQTSDFPSLDAVRRDVSPALQAVLARCTQRDPSARYADARALVQALRPLVTGDDDVLLDPNTGVNTSRAATVTPPPRSTLQKIKEAVVASEPRIDSVDVTDIDATMPPQRQRSPAGGRRRRRPLVLALGAGVLLAGSGVAWWFTQARLDSKASSALVKSVLLDTPAEGYLGKSRDISVRGSAGRLAVKLRVALVSQQGAVACPSRDVGIEDGGQFQATLTAPQDGAFVVRLEAEDNLGNGGEKEVAVRVDTEKPNLEVTEPFGSFVGGKVRLKGTVRDQTSVTVTVGDKPAVVKDGAWQCELELTHSPQTATEVVITARDEVGLASEKRRSLFVDAVLPIITLTMPKDGGVQTIFTRADRVPVAGTVTDETKFELSVDGRLVGPSVSGESVEPQNLPFATEVKLPVDGRREIALVATDAAGNKRVQNLIMWRHNKAPELGWSLPDAAKAVAAGKVEVKGTIASDLPGVSVTLTVNDVPARATVQDRTWSATVDVEAGSVTVVRVIARDPADNESAPLERSLRCDPAFDKQIRSGIDLIMIPVAAPQSFTMGSGPGEPDRVDDELPHRVTISKGFWLGETEVTQGQWTAVMETSPWQGKECVIEDDKAAVSHVSWSEAVEFCAKLTERERKAGRVPDGYRYTLPTEAEWELACRAGSATAYSFGDTGQAGKYAVFLDSRSGEYAHVVRSSRRANKWGLFDMHGNVWEWCLDEASWQDDRVFTKAYQDGIVDPFERGGPLRISRGGSWIDPAPSLRSAIRCVNEPRFASPDHGFRPALAARPDDK